MPGSPLSNGNTPNRSLCQPISNLKIPQRKTLSNDKALQLQTFPKAGKDEALCSASEGLFLRMGETTEKAPEQVAIKSLFTARGTPLEEMAVLAHGFLKEEPCMWASGHEGL